MRVHDDSIIEPIESEERSNFLLGPRRFECFSDSAFSIIITLLVLEIHRPQQLRDNLPKNF